MSDCVKNVAICRKMPEFTATKWGGIPVFLQMGGKIEFPKHYQNTPFLFGKSFEKFVFLSPAKGVGRLNNGARVQIPPTPPRKSLVVS